MDVSAENHIAAAPAIAAVWSATRHELLAPEANGTAPTVAGLREDFDSIDKHTNSSATVAWCTPPVTLAPAYSRRLRS
jgi:hypothetical protein